MRVRLFVLCMAAMIFATPVKGFAQAPAPPNVLRLDNGMPIIVTPVTDISSASAQTGQPVTFTVIHKCRVDGQILINDGTPVQAVIADARHSQMFGRQGILEITFLNTSTIDGSPLKVRASVRDNVVGATGNRTAGGGVQIQELLPYGLGFAFNGKDAVLRSGLPLTIFVDEDVDFQMTPGGVPQRITRPWVPDTPQYPVVPGQFP